MAEKLSTNVDLLDKDRFTLGRTEKNETGIRTFGLTDEKTGITMTFPEQNDELDYTTTVAWLGANTSRNGKTFGECFTDLRETLITDPTAVAGKFGGVVANYGHASVGDMAVMPLLVDNLPASLAYRFFNSTSIGAGQEWSTRYGKKDEFGLPPIEEIIGESDPILSAMWQGIQDSMTAAYSDFYKNLRADLDNYLTGNGINTEDAKSQSTLNARTLDVARMFLPVGVKTKLAYVDSVRDWVRISGTLRQSTDPYTRAFGEQITAMLLLDQREESGDIALHLEKFAKYAEGSDVANKSVRSIGELVLRDLRIPYVNRGCYIPNDSSNVELTRDSRFRHDSQTVFYNALLGLRPDLDKEFLKARIAGLTDEDLAYVSSRAFAGHNHHEPMHPAFDLRGTAITYETSLAYLRDINRHRSFGRHVLWFSAEDKPMAIIGKGFTDNFAMANAEYWQAKQEHFRRRQNDIFSDVCTLTDMVTNRYGANVGNSVLMHILPLGAQMTMVLSAPFSQWNYMTSLRVGMGGDFGYRKDVWQMLELIRQFDPGLTSTSSHLTKPNVNDPEQIMGRS